MPIPLASQSGSFVENSLSFNQLNIWRVDIPCVFENDVGEAAPSTQPVTLYLTVNITPPDLYNIPPSIPTNNNDSPAEEATIPGPIQFPVPEDLLPLSHSQTVEIGNTMPQSREEVWPSNPLNALDRADEAMKRIFPITKARPFVSFSERDGRRSWNSMTTMSKTCSEPCMTRLILHIMRTL
jgi:hypothetical protein